MQEQNSGPRELYRYLFFKVFYFALCCIIYIGLCNAVVLLCPGALASDGVMPLQYPPPILRLTGGERRLTKRQVAPGGFMNVDAWNNDLVEILLGDEEPSPGPVSARAVGHLVVRGYVLDPEDYDQPRFRLLLQPTVSSGTDQAVRPARQRAVWRAPDATRTWQAAAAQAASGTMPTSRPALRRRHLAGAGRSVPPAGN